MHDTLLEHYQNENNHGFFNIFVRSDSMASIFTSLIALHANHENVGGQATSVISFSGFVKLDKILNQLKMKVFSSITIMLKYIFTEMLVEEAAMAPLSTRMLMLLPHLIESAKLFATDSNLN